MAEGRVFTAHAWVEGGVWMIEVDGLDARTMAERQAAVRYRAGTLIKRKTGLDIDQYELEVTYSAFRRRS